MRIDDGLEKDGHGFVEGISRGCMSMLIVIRGKEKGNEDSLVKVEIHSPFR